jgi:polyisoprenoid-binding protein YceI
MKKPILVAIGLTAFAASAFTVLTSWNASDKSSVNWECGDKKGTFGKLSATINFDKSDLAGSKIAASIDVKTIKAGNEQLEQHLLSPDFFNAEKFPSISFTSTEVVTFDKGFLAKGTLTMKDSTKAVEFPFTFNEEGKDKAAFSGTMVVFAGDYGVTKKSKGGNDKVVIYMNVPVTK